MLTTKEVEFLREELNTSQNPLFFYDDDGDGLCAFLLLYRLKKEGKGSILKTSPRLTEQSLRKVEEYHPDKIFILDIAQVDQEFVNKAKRPIFWIDHHYLSSLQKVHYFNPRKHDPDSYIPTTRMAYQINNNAEDIWIAAIGCLFDWYMPDFIDQFIEKYPHLLPEKTDLATTVYQYPIGKLVRIFSFLLKGAHSEVTKSIKILTRIQSPDEILNQESPQGKYLYKRFESINKKYEILLHQAKQQTNRGKLMIFIYLENQWSFTADLANELTNLYPQKVIIICRKKSGEMKCSLRAQKPILPALEKALAGIDGHGGGHPNACGAVIKESDWDNFLIKFKEELKKWESGEN